MKVLKRLGVALGCIIALTATGSAQPIVYTEIQGFKIDATRVVMNTVRVHGQVRTDRVVYKWSVRAGTDGRLHHTQTNSVPRLDGTITNKTWSGASELGKPHPFRDGHVVWILDNDALIRLRTLDAGGAKLVLKLARDKNGFTCKIEMNYAQETGVGQIRGSSTASGRRLDILKEKELSSDCRVTKF